MTSVLLLWIVYHDRPNGQLMVTDVNLLIKFDVLVNDYLTHTRYIISKLGGSDNGALRKLVESFIASMSG